MKTNIIFALSAIIILAGLIITCQVEEVLEPVTVTFDSNGGSPVDPVTVGKGQGLGGSYTVPSRIETNITFNGWYDGFTEYTRDTGINTDITLIARWAEIVEYVNVSFDSSGGTPIGSIAVVKGGALGSKFPAAPRKKAFVFDQWLVDGVTLTKDTVITNAITAIAQWKTQTVTYTVTFDSNGGTDPAPITVFAGDCIDEWEARFPSDPQHEDPDYFLIEWRDEEGVPVTRRTPITKDVILTARWGIALQETTIELDLREFTTTHYNIAGAQSAIFANGVLTVTFTDENQGISIENPTKLKELLALANSVTVEIDGDVNHPDRLFRVLVGNPHKLGREWNATKSHDNVPFAELNRVLEIEEDNRAHDNDLTVWGDDDNPPNTPEMHRINWLFIQARGSNVHTTESPTVVTLRSVKITVK